MFVILSLLLSAEIFIDDKCLYNDYVTLYEDGRAYINGKFYYMLNQEDYSHLMRMVLANEVKHAWLLNWTI